MGFEKKVLIRHNNEIQFKYIGIKLKLNFDI